MAVETQGKEVAVTGDTATANVAAKGQPAQQRGPLLGPGDADFVSPEDYAAIVQEYNLDGHPVDAFSGAVIDEMVDLALPGLIPVELKRLYTSALASQRTPFGMGGWSFSLCQWVTETKRGLELKDERGKIVRLGPLAVGESTLIRAKRLQVTRRREGELVVYNLDTRLERHFAVTPNGRVALGQHPAWLREIKDRRGNRVQLHYEQEQPVTVTDTAGRELRLTYQPLPGPQPQGGHGGGGPGSRSGDSGQAPPAPPRVVTRAELWVEGKCEQQVSYGYHASGELAVATNALGHSDRYEYDGLHRMVKTTLKNGVSFHYRFDPESGQCTKTWGDGGLHSYSYQREAQEDGVLVTTAESEAPRLRLFSRKGELLSEKSYDESWETSKTFDEDGLTLSETNAAGETTAYAYDERGNCTAVVDPAGNETRLEYIEDLLVARTGPDGLTAHFRYDAYGDLSEVEEPTGARYLVRYDRHGRVESLVGPSGRIAELAYDEAHNLVEEKDARGAVWRYGYSPLGQPLRRTDPLGNVTEVQYDAMGQPTAVFFPDGTRTESAYEPLGNVSRLVDPLGLESRMTYVGTGSLSKQTAPDGSEWHFGYDSNERLRQIKNPKAELYEFDYDGQSRVIEERTFDGRTLRYGYDRAGRLRRVAQPDESYRSFRYDPLGNVLEEDSPHGKQIYERDPLGRLLKATVDEGPTVEVAFERDEYGRIVAERQGEHRLEYSFNRQSQRTERRVPGCGHTEYRYDVAGALQQVRHRAPEGREHVLSLTRDLLGREVLKASESRGVRVHSAYDALGRLIEQKIQAPGAEGEEAQALLSRRSWKYDSAGRVTEVDDGRWGATRYQYDRLGQLMRAERGQLHEVFDYQANGSLQKALNGLAPEQSPEGPGTWDIAQGNLLRRTDRHQYEYDAGSRRTSKLDRNTGARTQYIWDCRDRLREVRLPDGRRARYFYDAFGRRVRKELHPPPLRLLAPLASLPQGAPLPVPEEPELTFFLWDGDELAAELSETHGDRGHVHYPGSFVPLLQVERGEVFVVVTDHLGTPKELLGGDGRIRWSAAYTAWGKLQDEFVDDQQSPRGPPTQAGWHRDGSATAIGSGEARQAAGSGANPSGVGPAASSSAGESGARQNSAAPPRALRSPFRLLGQYYDEETGLAATRFRYWDADTGRWCSPDPLGIAGGENLSGFDGAPSTAVDPLGLSCDAARGETIFRVQGGVAPNASKIRFSVGADGRVAIAGDDMLFVNLGQEGRALEFLAKRGDTAELVRFQVTPEFATRLRTQAVPQRVGRQFPGRPQAVDATRAPDQFGIPSSMFDDLLNNIVPGTFRSGRP